MIGTTLSHYSIVAELGRGGMGIVYKARDTRLDREVAIKVLPASALSNEDDRARFYREAKAAASLSHPNIAAIYQIDEAVPEGASSEELRPFIAMEFINGETLESRIRKGPLKIKEAVRIAMQVAGALAAAHKKDIVHRDVKSANIMLTAEGDAKVLDFGLAQTTASTKLTRMGSTLGTVAYMSPEQARGDMVDARTDLWSLGIVLYEMVAGVIPFGADYEQAVVYSILNEPPEPLTAVRTGVPMELERIVGKALSKQADLRYQTGADLVADLKALDLADSGMTLSRQGLSSAHATHTVRVDPVVPANSGRSRKQLGMMAVAGVLLVALGLVAGGLLRPAGDPPRIERLMLDMDGMRMIVSIGISPGGRFIAMTGYDWDGNEGLFLFDTESGHLSYVNRSNGAFYPWFSPSGERLAYSGLSSAVSIVDVPSGTPGAIKNSGFYQTYWLDEDRLLVGQLGEDGPGTMMASGLTLSSGVVEPFEETRQQKGSQYPYPGPRIPESDLSVGNLQGDGNYGLEPRLFFLDIESGRYTQTDVPGINPQPLTSDILIYQQGDDAGELVVRRFDAQTQSFKSPPVAFIEDAGFALFQTDPTTGTLVFSTDNKRRPTQATVYYPTDASLVSFDIAGEDAQLDGARLSSDGSTLIGTAISAETGLSRVVTIDLETRSQVTRITNGTEVGLDLLPGGQLLTFHYKVDNGSPSDAGQLLRRSLTSNSADTLSNPIEFRYYGGIRDNRFLIEIDEEIGWLNPVDRSFKSLAAGMTPSLSPDGRFVAFNRTRQLMAVLEISSGKSSEITGIRGSLPRWSGDDRHLIFLDFEGMPKDVDVFREAAVSRLAVETSRGFRVTGEREFLLYAMHPRAMDYRNGRIVISAGGLVSTEPPTRRSPRVGLWRNVGQELERTLPR